MGTPISGDIVWCCDMCQKDIPKGEEIRLDPNAYNAYHKECYITLRGKS